MERARRAREAAFLVGTRCRELSTLARDFLRRARAGPQGQGLGRAGTRLEVEPLQTVRTAIGMPRPPLRRSRLKARIAAAYGTVRVLEQELRAASSALALGQGDMASCAAYVGRDASRYFSGKPGLSRVYPGFTWVLGRHPPVGRAVLAPARCTPLSVRGLARGTCRGVPPPPSCSHVLREWGRLGARGGGV